MIPLSPNSGLIGWVPHCDTIHSLIRDYREKKKIMLNIEHRLMLQVREGREGGREGGRGEEGAFEGRLPGVMPPLLPQMSSDYDHLTLMQKVEVFEQAIDSTSGDDLAKVLWLKSPSSEVTNYTCMSFASLSLSSSIPTSSLSLSPPQVWFDRRTNYTRSLAVMSMVGYILGLGDR